jgi:hypothetical protein
MDDSDLNKPKRQQTGLESESRRLRNELDTLRRSTLTSIRDRELQHQADIKKLEESHKIQLQRLTIQFEEKLNSTAAETSAAPADALLKEARQKWEIESRAAHARAAEDWANAERERMAKIKVEMAAEKQAAIQERDAYWQGKLPGSARVPEGSGVIPTYIGQTAKAPTAAGAEARRHFIPHPRTLAVLVGMFLLIAIGYLSAPQWQPLARSTMQSALSGASNDTQELIRTIAPWLISEVTSDSAT